MIEYYRGLFNHDVFINDDISTTNLVSAACDLYPEELYSEIDACFTNGRIDLGYLDMDWVSSVLTMGQEAALNKYLYENDSYDLINNVIKNMEWWACFQEDEAEDVLPEKLGLDFSRSPTISAPHSRALPKIGRNAPCPCGSDKKYKKCCLH